MITNSRDPTQRFSDRVDDYLRYRPDYPPVLFAWAAQHCALPAKARIADIGAGTGIASRQWLEAGYQVIAVEPNAEMRAAAEQFLGGQANFQLQEGRADATGLAAASVDLISVAQAFHWFDRETARREFARILKPQGTALIYWNSRRLSGAPFLDGYERLLWTYCAEYGAVTERYVDDASMQAWFGKGFIASACFKHRQQLDFEQLRGRLLSSSYAPRAGQSSHQAMLETLRELFEACQAEGQVDMDYDTRVFTGHLF